MLAYFQDFFTNTLCSKFAIQLMIKDPTTHQTCRYTTLWNIVSLEWVSYKVSQRILKLAICHDTPRMWCDLWQAANFTSLLLIFFG